MPPESERVSAALKRAVRDRANNICEYCCCLGEYCPNTFTVDHIQPRHLGGKTILENLAWACYGCNGRKQGRSESPDPETKQLVPLFNPRQQIRSEHFSGNEDETQMSGQTPCGRATISALDLNRPSVTNLRRLLITIGLHPPYNQNPESSL
ncbi:MAG: HNH endonuclease [Leptolyngbya sp. Prado105]|nr:HNH endonuclease [Leptolyngbya sp. Prado105]